MWGRCGPGGTSAATSKVWPATPSRPLAPRKISIAPSGWKPLPWRKVSTPTESILADSTVKSCPMILPRRDEIFAPGNVALLDLAPTVEAAFRFLDEDIAEQLDHLLRRYLAGERRREMDRRRAHDRPAVEFQLNQFDLDLHPLDGD